MLDKFTKDMLKPGMLVETRDGSLRKLGVLSRRYSQGGGYIALIKEDGMYLDFSNYTEDLNDKENDSQYDIIKVYSPKRTEDNFSFSIEDHELIWERPGQTIVLTHDEIAEKLGIEPRELLISSDGMTYKNGAWRKE